MDLTLFWLVFVVFGLAYFAVAMYSSQKVVSNDEYFLAGRTFNTATISLTLIATQLGAGLALGTADEAYSHGLYGVLYNAGMCIGLIILGFGLAGKLRGFNISTTAELFETKYNSPLLRKVASALSVLTLGGILAGQIVASRKLIGTFSPDFMWILTCFWVVVIFYTMYGGLRAVVATDIFQVIVITAVFVLAFAIVLGASKTPLNLSVESLLETQKAYFSTTNISLSHWSGFMLMPILFSLIEQDLAQRFFASKNKNTAIASAFIASVCIFLFSLIPLYFGAQAQIRGLVVPKGASVLLISVMEMVGSFGLILIVCALIAAICSTADSLLCAIGSNIIYDFNLDTPQKKSYGLAVSRVVTFATGICALFLAHYFNSIISLITKSYEISVSCLFVPLVICYFKKSVYKEAAFASVCCGFLGYLIFSALPLSMPREVATLMLSLLGYIAGHTWGELITRHNRLSKEL